MLSSLPTNQKQHCQPVIVHFAIEIPIGDLIGRPIINSTCDKPVVLLKIVTQWLSDISLE